MSRLVLSYVAEVASNSQSSSLPHTEITETPPGVAFKKMFIFFLCICVFCLHVYVSVLRACAHRNQEGSRSLELQTILSHHVGAGNRSLALCQQQQVFLSTKPSLQPHTFTDFAHVYVCVTVCAVLHVWRPEDNLRKFVFYHVGPGD